MPFWWCSSPDIHVSSWISLLSSQNVGLPWDGQVLVLGRCSGSHCEMRWCTFIPSSHPAQDAVPPCQPQPWWYLGVGVGEGWRERSNCLVVLSVLQPNTHWSPYLCFSYPPSKSSNSRSTPTCLSAVSRMCLAYGILVESNPIYIPFLRFFTISDPLTALLFIFHYCDRYF